MKGPASSISRNRHARTPLRGDPAKRGPHGEPELLGVESIFVGEKTQVGAELT